MEPKAKTCGPWWFRRICGSRLSKARSQDSDAEPQAGAGSLSCGLSIHLPQWCPFTLFGGRAPLLLGYRKTGTLILTSLLEDLATE